MSAKVYPAKSHQCDQETCGKNNNDAPAPVWRFCEDVCSDHAIEHSSHHRVAAGKTVAGESQDRIVEMRSRAVKRIFQKPVEQRPANDG